MLLRKYILILFMGISGLSFAQTVGTSSPAHQSSVKGNRGANYAIDGNMQSYSTAQTNNSSNSWWEVDLEGVYTIQAVNISSPTPLTNVYVIISQTALFPYATIADDFETNGLFVDGLIDRGATVFTIDDVTTNNLSIPFNDEVGQFVSVVSSVWSDLGITEIEVIKTGPLGTDGPFGKRWLFS